MYTLYRLLTISSLCCITRIRIRNKTVDIVVFDILSVEMDDLSVMIMIVINLTPPPHNTFTLCFLQTHFGLRSRWWLLALCQSLLHLIAGFDTVSTINYPKVWICFWHIQSTHLTPYPIPTNKYPGHTLSCCF